MSEVRLILATNDYDANGVADTSYKTLVIENEELEKLLADKNLAYGNKYKVVGAEVVDARGATERAESASCSSEEEFQQTPSSEP